MKEFITTETFSWLTRKHYHSCTRPWCSLSLITVTVFGTLIHHSLGQARVHSGVCSKIVHKAMVRSLNRTYLILLNLGSALLACTSSTTRYGLYLKPLSKPAGDIWFQPRPVDHNILGSVVKHLCDAAGLQGHYTNHSLRATAATRLFEAGVNEQLIMQRTRHSTTAGMRSYKRIGEKLRWVTSDVLNSAKRSNWAQMVLLMGFVNLAGATNWLVPPIGWFHQLAGSTNFIINFNLS